jgi:hypothetical protein
MAAVDAHVVLSKVRVTPSLDAAQMLSDVFLRLVAVEAIHFGTATRGHEREGSNPP